LNNSTYKNILLLVLISIGAKVLGFGRELMIANKFGASSDADAFFVALTLSSLIGALIGQSLNTVMIPLLTEIRNKNNINDKNRFTSNLLGIIILFSILLVVISYLLSPVIVNIVAYGFDINQYNLTLKLFRVGLLSVLLTGVMSVLRAYLQSEKKFNESAFSEMAINISYLFFLFFYADNYGVYGLMLAGVFGVLIQVFIQIIALRSTKFSYKFLFDIRDLYIKKVIVLSAPIFLTVIVNDINKSVDKALASSLIEGSVSALSYGNRINVMIFGIFITSIATIIFTDLSDLAANKSFVKFKKTFLSSASLIILLTIPLTLMLIVFSNQIVSILFERGLFNSKATEMTSSSLVYYSIGLTGLSLRLLLVKTFFSLQLTKVPMINSIIAVVFNIILSVILVKTMKHDGLALASSLSITFISIIMFFSLRRKIGYINYKYLGIIVFKTIIAALTMTLLSKYVYNILYINNTMIISLLISLTIGLVVYIIICSLLKVKELNLIILKIKNK
jgi:putative peptidoglycan lipid II flippase